VHTAIPYYRVSTQAQGQSGLGLDAQKQAVAGYMAQNAFTPLLEFTEVESGRKKKRPELEKALTACRKEKATLIIAKLDRLSRNVLFIASLLESKVDFIALDNPEANKLMFHMLRPLLNMKVTGYGHESKMHLQQRNAGVCSLVSMEKYLPRKTK
jgi:DNA invertase Pin-like site-specific DNA recombinase